MVISLQHERVSSHHALHPDLMQSSMSITPPQSWNTGNKSEMGERLMRQQSFAFVWAYGLLVIYLRLELPESFSNFMPDFLGNCQTAFQSGSSVSVHPHLPRPSVCTPSSHPARCGPSWLFGHLVWGRAHVLTLLTAVRLGCLATLVWGCTHHSHSRPLRPALVVWPPWLWRRGVSLWL